MDHSELVRNAASCIHRIFTLEITVFRSKFQNMTTLCKNVQNKSLHHIFTDYFLNFFPFR